MGGDTSPEINVEAAHSICSSHKDINIILSGREKEIFSCLKSFGPIPQNLEIVNCDESISMEDSPAESFRSKPDSSIHKGISLLKEGKGDAFYSTGNTGAVVAASYFILGLIDGISRPALSILFPAHNGRKIVLLDLGATVDAKASHLKDFALMGSEFSKIATGKSNPEVSILSVGKEQIKGKSTVLRAAEKIAPIVNYAGFVEGNNLFDDPAFDVVVTDGFTGNILLKTLEGLSETLLTLIKENSRKSIWFRLYTFLFRHALTSQLSRFDYSLYGAGLLLGPKKLIGIGHGRSNVSAFKTGILSLHRYVSEGFNEKFVEQVKAGTQR